MKNPSLNHIFTVLIQTGHYGDNSFIEQTEGIGEIQPFLSKKQLKKGFILVAFVKSQ